MGAGQGMNRKGAAAIAIRGGVHVPPRRDRARAWRAIQDSVLSRPLHPYQTLAARASVPDYVLTTEQIGRAMLIVARHGFPTRVLESRDIRSAVHP